MKRSAIFTILAAITIALAAGEARANDIDVYNVKLQNYQPNSGDGNPGGASTIDIKFDLGWKNVYPSGLVDGNSQPYFDRAWVFVKYIRQDQLGGANNVAWKHATLKEGGSISKYVLTDALGNVVGKGLVNNTSDNSGSAYLGAFCTPGANQIVRWAIGQDESFTSATDPNRVYIVRVYAIEMVYVPTGPFYLGSTGSPGAGFTQGAWTSTRGVIPFKVTDASITVGNQTTSQLTMNSSTNYTNFMGTTPRTLLSTFPTGYKGFYVMKYEISQGQYTDFLNTLTRQQQTGCISASIAVTATTPQYYSTGGAWRTYVMSNAYQLSDSSRNTIQCPLTFTASVPISFTTTTPHRACNFLNWQHFCSYADWAGLRPMTEFEFEKACRGGSNTSNSVQSERAWGTANITGVTTISNDGTASEASTSSGNCLYNISGRPTGPMRCGFAATSSSSREQAGASFYGVMEMSGNLKEICVNMNNNGERFDGSHGDGSITTTGYGNVPGWPGYVSATSGIGALASPVAAGLRGGSYMVASSFTLVSDRSNAYSGAVDGGPTGSDEIGGHCVRTAPQ